MAVFQFGVFYFVAYVIIAFVFYGLYNVLYNAILHPLRRIPGPFWWRVSRIPASYHNIRGTLCFDLLRLHQKYGPVVRIAPNELSFSNSSAWKDIHRCHGKQEFEKSREFYWPYDQMVCDIVNAPQAEHNHLRKHLSLGFSDRSMKEQQPMIMKYIDLLMKQLRDQCGGGSEPLDIASWYNFATFDIIGDLAFGEPFGCLKNSYYHPWVKAIFGMGRAGVLLHSAAHYSIIKRILFAMIPEKIRRERQNHLNFTKAKVQKRLELNHARPDLIEGLLKSGCSVESLEANSSILIMAGSETTATLLSGVTFFLLTNTWALERLTQEVRSSFRSEEDIDSHSVSNLPFMLACLDEALRLYPPLPNGLPRVVPAGGARILGILVPENTVVAVPQWATYHNSDNFKKPFEFHPERWLGDPEFDTDDKDAFQPFHVGPRNCLGRNLAYVEMRIILARLLWNFDIKISLDSQSWMEAQRVFIFWEKVPLLVHLTPTRR